jgi:Tol biopolymer transport system component
MRRLQKKPYLLIVPALLLAAGAALWYFVSPRPPSDDLNLVGISGLQVSSAGDRLVVACTRDHFSTPWTVNFDSGFALFALESPTRFQWLPHEELHFGTALSLTDDYLYCSADPCDPGAEAPFCHGFLYDLATGERRQVHAGPPTNRVSEMVGWDPSGQRLTLALMMCGDVHGRPELFCNLVAYDPPSETSEVLSAPPFEHHVTQAAWSAAGDYLYYLGDEDHLYRVPFDDSTSPSTPERLSSGWRILSFDLSPSGDRLVFAGYPRSTRGKPDDQSLLGIYMVYLDGSQYPQRLSEHCGAPLFSLDGQWVAYRGAPPDGRGRPEQGELWVCRADTPSSEKLIVNGLPYRAAQFVWTADDRLVYVSGAELRSVKPDGTDDRLLFPQ